MWWVLAAIGSVLTTVAFDLDALQAFYTWLVWGAVTALLLS